MSGQKVIIVLNYPYRVSFDWCLVVGGRRVCALIVLMNSLSFSWTKGCAGGSGVLICLAGVGFRPGSCSFGAEGRSLSRRKLYMSVVCLFAVVS